MANRAVVRNTSEEVQNIPIFVRKTGEEVTFACLRRKSDTDKGRRRLGGLYRSDSFHGPMLKKLS